MFSIHYKIYLKLMNMWTQCYIKLITFKEHSISINICIMYKRFKYGLKRLNVQQQSCEYESLRNHVHFSQNVATLFYSPLYIVMIICLTLPYKVFCLTLSYSEYLHSQTFCGTISGLNKSTNDTLMSLYWLQTYSNQKYY